MNLCRSLTFIFLLISQDLYSQSKTGIVSGSLIEKDGKPCIGINIVIEGSNLATTTDENGNFELKNVPPGEKTIIFSGIGFLTRKKTVTIFSNSRTELKESLEESSHVLGEVAIEGKTESQNIRETGFSVNSLELKSLQNQNLDLNTVLNQTAGIRVRQEGGLGSSYNLLLNGFSSNQVKFFIDGIPMDNFGSSLTLNNIPVNLVSRIDIYKGVIPVFLGADALGGAINIVTDQKKRNFADISYSYGSFNTHRAAAIARITNGKTGFTVNTKGIFNYSDNNYWVDVEIPNSATSKTNGVEKVRRFHDGYQSQTVELELGLVNKKYADRLFIGLIASGNYKEIQSGVNMTKVAGEAYTTDKVLIPTFKYAKSNLFTKGLDFDLYANYNAREAFVGDTSSRVYNWRGEYTVKTIDNSGELNWDKTLFRFNDKSTSAVSNLKYRLSQNHSFSFNNTFSHYTRIGSDPISVSAVPFSQPNTLVKNITGISYDGNFFDGRLKLSLFGKNFIMNASTLDEEYGNNELIRINKNYSFNGYGIAGSFFITPWLLGKASYENTLRIPEAFEMFGNGLLIQANPQLKPEKSQNFNIGVISTLKKGKHKLILEGGYLYRLPKNLIRQAVVAVVSTYENISSVRVSCFEAAVKYQFDKYINLEVNGTYQDLVNTNRYEPSGALSVLYMDRLPNIPFLFANASAGLTFNNLFTKGSKLTLGYTTNFVEAFYLKWPSQGSKKDKYDIPRQLSHTVSASYSLFNEKYNISLACTNVTDEILYDNFMLQKPGRAFSVKLRYFISKE